VGEGRIDRDFGEVLAVQTVLPLSFMFYYEPGGSSTPAATAMTW
jgi:hypothetical protein